MNTFLKVLSLALCAIVLTSILAPDAAAQTLSAKEALNDPTTANAGLTSGLTAIVQNVYLILKALAIIAGGYGSYMMWKGEISSGVWAFVAAICMFMAPTIVDFAQTIGRSSAGNTTSIKSGS